MKALLVEGYIAEKANDRSVQGRFDGHAYRVCTFLLAETRKPDAENSINLILWEGDIDKFRVGDKVKISNGYTTKFNETLQLNVGKYGTIMLA